MTTTPELRRPVTILRRVLALDAVATGGTGLVYLVAAGPLARLFEVDSRLLLVVGAVLAVYGAAVGLLATRPQPAVAAVRLVVALNTAWVLLTAVALAAAWIAPSPIGTGWAVVKALIVAGFAIAQAWSLRSWRATC